MIPTFTALGGVSVSTKLNLTGERNTEHKPLYDALSHPDVQAELTKVPGATGQLQAVEFASQVVQGMKYIVTLKDEKDVLFQVHVWQKPFNSVVNEMPPPVVVKIAKLTEPAIEL